MLCGNSRENYWTQSEYNGKIAPAQKYCLKNGFPQIATRDHFLRVTEYQLDGMHPFLHGILLAGDDKGNFYMFKQTPHGSNEAIFASRVCGRPFMVASSYKIIDPNGITHRCGGLLMRRFETSLLGNVFNCLSLLCCTAL